MDDWNLLRSFVAVARHGSLSAAAEALGSSQPTLSRHIGVLEEQLGVSLFGRHARGLELTERGTALYEHARRVADEVDAFARAAAGLDHRVAGTVRLSASRVVANFVLPAILTDLLRDHPDLEVEVVADDRASNLLRRDADIAIRMFRPTQLDLVARQVGEAPLGFYASVDYLKDRGEPPSLDALAGHRLIGMDREDLHLKLMAHLEVTSDRRDFAIRSDDQPFHLQAALAGLGIAGLQVAIARRHPSLRRVLAPLALPSLPVWLVAHDDVRRSARVRAAYDHLAAALGALYG